MTRTFANHPFQHIATLNPERTPSGDIATYRPQDDAELKEPLHAYGDLTYCRLSVDAPAEGGVYVITVEDWPQYVGKSDNLRRAINYQIGTISPSNCTRANGQPTNCRLNHEIYRAAAAGRRIDLYFHPTGDGETVKRAVLAAAPFPWNR